MVNLHFFYFRGLLPAFSLRTVQFVQLVLYGPQSAYNFVIIHSLGSYNADSPFHAAAQFIGGCNYAAVFHTLDLGLRTDIYLDACLLSPCVCLCPLRLPRRRMAVS